MCIKPTSRLEKGKWLCLSFYTIMTVKVGVYSSSVPIFFDIMVDTTQIRTYDLKREG